MSVTTISRIVVVRADSGRVYKLDKEADTMTMYSNETKFNADDSFGTIKAKEFKDVYEAILAAIK